jgi:hypothetical protein
MSELKLELPDELAAALAGESRSANLGQEEMALDLLRRALAMRRFRGARESILKSLGGQGPDSDESVFEQIS